MAELINKTDTLNEGREKLNEAIKDAGQAKWESGRALITAESTKVQLDTIVIEGDSSVEAAQARVDANGVVHNTLKDRLDSEYNDISSQIDGKVNMSEYMTKINEMEQGINGNSADINSIKDSMSGIKLENIPEPLYIAHRGAKNIFPESSMEAYRGCVNLGVKLIEMDVRVSADGALICHHYDTMERTTNKTGQVKYYSAMGFKSAIIDELPGWKGTPVLFEDLIREFGNKVIYVPEVKDFEDSTSEKLTNLIVEYGLQDNTLIQSFSAPNLVYPRSKGIPVCYLRSNTDISANDIAGWGFESVGVSSAIPNSYITDCINAGLKVYIYTVNRRYERDKYLNLGVHGFFTDDPLWLNGQSPTLERDPYHEQVFTHGHISPPKIDSYTDGNRGEFIAPNKFGWTEEGETSDFSLQGWAGRLTSTFTLNYRINFVKSVSSVRWASVAICTPNDYWDDYNNSLCAGYHILLRESGTIDVYKRVIGQAATLLQSVNTSPISQGQSATIKVQVTASSIIVTRVDTAHTLTINDDTFRGGYLHFGRRMSGVTFENVQVIRQ